MGGRCLAAKKEVTLYTDGACLGNPGPGGWAALLEYGRHAKELSGGAAATTNNRMELAAVIEGLKALKEPCRVTVYSDSAYVVNAFRQGWIDRWQQGGWRTSRNDPVENQDLWRELVDLVRRHDVQWRKVKGHADDERNNRCDALARSRAEEYRGETE